MAVKNVKNVNGYVLRVMYYVLRFCCSAVHAGRDGSEYLSSERVLHRKAFCTRVSRLSKMVVKQKMVVFKDTPKYRSGGNVRSFKQASFAETGS